MLGPQWQHGAAGSHSRGSHSRGSHGRGSHGRGSHSRGSHSRGSFVIPIGMRSETKRLTSILPNNWRESFSLVIIGESSHRLFHKFEVREKLSDLIPIGITNEPRRPAAGLQLLRALTSGRRAAPAPARRCGTGPLSAYSCSRDSPQGLQL